MKIGWIGLGAMGLPMATRLAQEGFDVAGFDVNPAVEFPRGAMSRLVADPAAAAEGAAVVVIMVATPAQAESVMHGPRGVLATVGAGVPVVVTATIGPPSAVALAEQTHAAGARFVDAPVSGGVARARTGELLIMVGGDSVAVAAVTPVLDSLSARWHHVGAEPGDGQRMKLVNQLLCGVHIAAAAEALAFAETLGIDAGRALDVVSGGAAASFMLTDRGGRMAARDFDPPRSAVDIFVKDLGLVAEAADRPLPLAAAALSRFELAHDLGFGRRDDSSLLLTYLDSAAPEERAHDTAAHDTAEKESTAS